MSIAKVTIKGAEANARRAALVAAGCSTYVLMGDIEGNYGVLISCCCCGYLSHNRNDAKNRYCSWCHQFHSEWREQDAIASTDPSGGATS